MRCEKFNDIIHSERLLKSNPKNPIIASFKELALKMNVLLSTVNRLLVRLQEENIIVREGNNRKGRWVIKTIMSMNITKPIIRKIKDIGRKGGVTEIKLRLKKNNLRLRTVKVRLWEVKLRLKELLTMWK